MHASFALLALIASTFTALAQESKIQFRTLALFDTRFPELWVMESGKPVSIRFPASQPSTPFKADRSAPFGVFKGPLDGQGKPADTTPTLVTLPSSASILLLGWMEGETPRFLAMEDAFLTMKNDDWLVINASNTPYALQIGEGVKPILIKPNSHQPVKNTAPAGTGAAVTLASQQGDGKWKAAYTSFWPVYDDKRGLILIVQRGSRLNVNYIADPIAPPPEDKQAARP